MKKHPDNIVILSYLVRELDNYVQDGVMEKVSVLDQEMWQEYADMALSIYYFAKANTPYTLQSKVSREILEETK